MKESSETLALKLQSLLNKPEDSIQHSEHDGSLKSRLIQYLKEGKM
jgi:hypothetical protein